MSQYAVQVQGLSKKYHIGGLQAGEQTFREAMTDMVRAPFRRIGKLFSGQAYGAANLDETIWALKDINFNVKHGEIIGIIGHNGAGKSTLLKILSRITEPTSGEIRLYGRVGALLEVGTGFHAELTGRENIYLNGTILGMSRAEINKKFDEIVDFSGIEKFIDTPVKHYSSGMGLRLGFAVAAHLEPEILIVDEVLAVGDAEFQRKCLSKIYDVAHGGRTVLLVSHNMQAIKQISNTVVWLHQGQIRQMGDVQEVVDQYLQINPSSQSLEELHEQIKQIPPDPTFELSSVVIEQNDQAVGHVLNGMPFTIRINYRVKETMTGLRVYFDLTDLEDTLLFRSFHDEQASEIPVIKPGDYISEATIPANLLAPKPYTLIIRAGIHNLRTCIPSGVRYNLAVESSNRLNQAYLNDPIRGKLAPRIEWQSRSC